MAYPGTANSPGMVSWIVRMRYDTRTKSVPDDVYKEGVSSVFASVERLDG